MARVNVYLPDQLAAAVRPLGLNLSNVLQGALQERTASALVDGWLRELPSAAAPRVEHRAVLEALERIAGPAHGQ